MQEHEKKEYNDHKPAIARSFPGHSRLLDLDEAKYNKTASRFWEAVSGRRSGLAIDDEQDACDQGTDPGDDAEGTAQTNIQERKAGNDQVNTQQNPF
jgi:hypothetical protein